MDTYEAILNSTPSAALALKKYGVPKSAATYILHNHFKIPEVYTPIFKAYYLLHWEISYFRSSLLEGTIERKGISYQVIYYRTDPIAIAKASCPVASVLLSFRELAPEYGAVPTVLVTMGTATTKENKQHGY